MPILKALLITAALLAASATAHAELRLELAAGVARHRLAPEGSWWYDGFPTDVRLRTSAFTAGIAWTPLSWGKTRLGVRAGYSDLGRVTSDNSFPIHEDRSIHDSRVNPNCDRATLSGCNGRYQGSGKTRGFYFGPAVERDFGPITLGAEAGLYVYRSHWVAINWRAYDAAGEFTPPGWDQIHWDHVRDEHGTWYTGLNARWNGLFVSWRHYANVRAGDTSKGPLYIGMTSGPLWSFMVGASLPF
jgi:hypothetical protein